MSSYGLKVFSADGPDIMLDSSCTMCCILGICEPYQEQTGIYVPFGYEYHVHYTIGCSYNVAYDYDSDIGGESNAIVGACDASSYLDGNRQVILTKGRHAWGDSYFYDNLCIIIGYPLHNLATGTGISFAGDNNFFSIHDESLCAPVVFKGEITLPPNAGGWSPEYVNPYLNFNNCIVFVYCENPNVSIGLFYNRNNGSRKIFAFDLEGGFYKGSVDVRLVIFAKQRIKETQYGLKIFNKKGKVVYDSASEILMNPQLYSFGQVGMRQFVGIPDIRRPMFIPTSIGAYADFDKYRGDLKTVGLASNGFSLAPSYTGLNEILWTIPFRSQFMSDRPVMILDAENYFKF